MDLVELGMGELERVELEHGLCRSESPPEGECPWPPITKVAETPVVREKPFLVVDAKGQYECVWRR